MTTISFAAGRRFALASMLFVLAAAPWPTTPGRAQVYGVTLPDISNKTLIVRPNKVPAGERVEITSAAQNRGTGAFTTAYSFEQIEPLAIRFLLVSNVKDASGIDAGGWTVAELDRRETRKHSAWWTVPDSLAPAMYFLCADIDPDNTVRESNEHNNRTCQPLTVEPAVEIVLDEPVGQDEAEDGHVIGDFGSEEEGEEEEPGDPYRP